MKIIKVMFVSLYILAGTAKADSVCDSGKIPRSLYAKLMNDSHSWRIVTASDLRIEDQATWSAQHSDKCPGISEGRYIDEKKASYAINVFKEKSGKLYQALFIGYMKNNTFLLKKISNPEEVAYLSVITTITARLSSEEIGIKIPHDGVLYESLDVGSIIYYYDGSIFTSTQITE